MRALLLPSSLRWVCLMIVCTLFASCGKDVQYEEVERETGYRGPARQNPYLAAERLLREFDYGVTHATDFRQMPNEHTTIVTTGQSFLNYGDTQAALEWVRSGGHLLVMLQGGEQWRDDWQTTFTDDLVPSSREEEEDNFWKAMNLKSVNASSTARPSVRVDGKNLSVELRGELNFSIPVKYADIKGEDSLISFRKGVGRVTLLAHAAPFRNRYISDYDHAALFLALATMENHDTVCFLNGSRTSFLAMLWQRAWMAIVILGALILAWLWRNFPRFGPTFAPEERATREFIEHLRLAGAYWWRRRNLDVLVGPLQRDVRLAIARRGLNIDDAANSIELTARIGLPIDRIRRAVSPFEPAGTLPFIRLVQDLQTIRAKV